MRRAVLLLLALSAVPAVTQAQVCVGQAPWSSGSLKVGGSLELGDGYTEILGGVGIGRDRGLFGGAAGGIISNGGSDFTVAATGGLELSNPIADKLELCPVAAVQLIFFEGATENSIMGGASLGYPIDVNSEKIRLILTGGLVLGRVGGGGDSDFQGILDAGAGIIFNNRISLVPLIRIPVSCHGCGAAFAVRANIAVGGGQ